MNEKKKVNIKKTIHAQLIVSQLAFLITNLYKNKHDKSMIVNKSTLTEGFYEKFMYNFFTNNKFTKYFLLNFIDLYIDYVKSNIGKSYLHTCKRSNFKWYFKKYMKSPKKTKRTSINK